MLRNLTVRDFVIVDCLELDFISGFSALTGETGAGKSILIDALQLALGGRADATMVRDGAKKADITAEFSLSDSVRSWLSMNDIESEEMVLLRRTIDASSGRSRCFVNGITVTTAQMRMLGALLVDIHGQHAHQLLMKNDEQRALLDRHAGIGQEVAILSDQFKAWKLLEKRFTELQAHAEQMKEERELLEWQVHELEKIQPKVNEWEQVSQDYDRLSHAASLLDGVSGIINELSETDHSILSRINAISQTAVGLSEIDQKLMPVVDLLDSSKIQLQEAVYTLRDYLAHIDLESDQLHIVEKRMEALYSMARQFRILPEALPMELERRQKKLIQFKEESNLDRLKKQVSQAEAAYKALAQEISVKRQQAAQELSHAVTAIMQDLHMEGGQFSVAINKASPHTYGTDAVEFLVSGHSGAVLRPLAKIASGGELARISLAISVIASEATATPTLIFDEVDSGIGGAVAEMVGQLLKRLGGLHQVLCVTHLPQVASQAQQHYQVSKQTVSTIAHPVSRITRLSDQERVTEIARMLGGTTLTSKALDHAREMLEQQEQQELTLI